MKSRATRALSLGLRIAALGSRYVLFFCLAIYLEPEDVGLYGLIAATVSYLSLAVGVDFYLYANREFKQSHETQKRPILRSSLKVYAGTYLLALPCLMLFFAGGLLPWHLAGLFFVVLVLEHMGQEVYRVLVMMEHILLAAWVLFLRLGLWAIVFSCLMVLSAEFRTLEMLLVAWCIGAFLSISFAIRPFLDLSPDHGAETIGNGWVLRGLKIALPFLIGSLCLRGMVTFDRYFVQMFNSREILGVYVFFAGMAATLPALLEAGVFSFINPKLISAVKEDNAAEISRLFYILFRDTVVAISVFVLLSVIGAQVAAAYLPHQIYRDNIVIFYLCLAAQIPLSLSMVCHFLLYARRHDVLIILSHVLSFVVFVTIALLIGSTWPLVAVPIALIGANATLMATKYMAYRHYRRVW